MLPGDLHYPADIVGAAVDLPGAGILAWLTGDQLHPPMIDDDTMWSDGDSWAGGARSYVLQLGDLASLRPDDHVLDVGCGVCGPARALVDAFGVRVTAVTNSQAHANLSRKLNQIHGVADRIAVAEVKDVDDWPPGQYTVVWSVNMLYQVTDHQELFGKAADSLSAGGRIVVDDWMVSDSVTEEDLREFKYHFQFRNFVALGRVEKELVAAGFYPPQLVSDRGDAARGPMASHFEPVMREHFLPKLASQWPSAGVDGIDGAQMAVDFIEAVNVTLRMYQEGKLTYRTLVALLNTGASIPKQRTGSSD